MTDGYGAMLQALGVVASTAGAEQGTSALQQQTRRELADSQRFNGQRQALLGRYVGTLGPMMQTEDATTTDVAMRNNGAIAASAPGAQALGIHPGAAITPASRVGMRQVGMRRRLMGDELNQMGLDSNINEVERHRNDAALLYEEQRRRAGKAGSNLRLLGSMLGASGQAVNTGEMVNGAPSGQRGVDPDGYSNNPYATDRPQGPSAYRGY